LGSLVVKTGDVQVCPTGAGAGALVVDVVGAGLVAVLVGDVEVVGDPVRVVVGDAVVAEGVGVAGALAVGDGDPVGVEPAHVTFTTVGLVAT
jgi:hypothetical protein